MTRITLEENPPKQNKVLGIPSGWSHKNLGELCEKTQTANPEKTPGKKFIYVDVSSVSNASYQIIERNEIIGKEAPSRARKVINADDIIFATVRPTLRRIAMVDKELDGQLCSTGFCVIRTDKAKLDPNYAYFFLLSEYTAKRVESLQKGATYPAINDSDLLELLIPLPPIFEQKAIAKALVAVQEAREARRREAALERERKATLMDYLFTHGTQGEPRQPTEIGEIPQRWQVVRLGEISKVRYGLGQPPQLDDNGIPMIRATDIKNGKIISDGVLKVKKEAIPKSRSPFLTKGDILVVRSGAYTGDVAMYDGRWEEAIAGYDLVLIRK